MNTVILPKITKARLTGFAPLFSKPVELNFSDKANSFLVLGGNGLGKTTILQSIVFGIAGIASTDIQDAREDSRFKWEMSYFKKRVADPQNAEVLVEFQLGDTLIEVRRGLDSEAVRGVRINNEERINSSAAKSVYESNVIRASNCSSMRDLRYLVHRLCYLPESRRNIVWDPDAQLALFLFICADGEVENDIRAKNLRLREDIVEMRHMHTAITNIKKRIKSSREIGDGEHKIEALGDASTNIHEGSKVNFEDAKRELLINSNKITQAIKDLEEKNSHLRVVSDDIEEGEDKLSRQEEQAVLKTLQKQNTAESNLALQRIVRFHQCPYCTQKADPFAVKAQEFLSKGLCPICGLRHIDIFADSDLTTTVNVLKNKIEIRGAIQNEIKSLRRYLDWLRLEGERLESELDKLTLQLPRIRKDEQIALSNSVEDLEKTLVIYEAKHDRLKERVRKQTETIEREYTDIENTSADRYRLIEYLIERYATKFLGSKCTFERVKGKSVDKDIPFSFDVLVPSFNGSQRMDPQSCSESQAFFLDIAFRMAMLDAVHRISHKPLTFICETPESALDLAYAENVAEMFLEFTSSGCSALLTANLQMGGVAAPIMATSKSLAVRKKNALNLLDFAELSSVQEHARDKFQKQFEQMLQYQTGNL